MVERSIEFLRPRSRVAYLLRHPEKEREREKEGRRILAGVSNTWVIEQAPRTRGGFELFQVRRDMGGVASAWRGAFYSLGKSNAEIRPKIPDSPENPGNARYGVSCGAYARSPDHRPLSSCLYAAATLDRIPRPEPPPR